MIAALANQCEVDAETRVNKTEKLQEELDRVTVVHEKPIAAMEAIVESFEQQLASSETLVGDLRSHTVLFTMEVRFREQPPLTSCEEIDEVGGSILKHGQNLIALEDILQKEGELLK